MDWIIKNNYIGSAFFDASASAFVLPSLTRVEDTEALGNGKAMNSEALRCQEIQQNTTVAGKKDSVTGSPI